MVLLGAGKSFPSELYILVLPGTTNKFLISSALGRMHYVHTIGGDFESLRLCRFSLQFVDNKPETKKQGISADFMHYAGEGGGGCFLTQIINYQCHQVLLVLSAQINYQYFQTRSTEPQQHSFVGVARSTPCMSCQEPNHEAACMHDVLPAYVQRIASLQSLASLTFEQPFTRQGT